LKDYCGAYRREISALVGAMEERIPLELKSSWQRAMTPEAMRARLVQRLEENRGLAPDVAGWAVDAWSYALGVGLARRSDRVQAAVMGTSSVGAAASLPGGESCPAATGVASDTAVGAKRATFDQSAKELSIAHMSGPKKLAFGAAAALILGAAAFAVIEHHGTSPPPSLASNPSPAPIVNPAPQPEIAPDPVGDGKNTSEFLPAGTVVSVHLDAAVNSDNLKVGDFVDATVSSPVTVDGNVVVPPGTEARLKVTGVERAEKDGEAEHLQLSLVELGTGQGQMEVTTKARQFNGPTMHVEQARRSGIRAAAGAVGGFVKGKLFRHGGAGGAAAPKGQPVMVTAETPIQFRLSAGVKPPAEAVANK
jgi:hypothetical protein